MSGAARATKTRTPAPAVELVRMTCSLCHEMALCASVRDTDTGTCFLCSLSMAQLISSAQRANQRPDPRPCHCDACVTFDEGQRGEVANAKLLDVDGASLSRWSVLEVD